MTELGRRLRAARSSMVVNLTDNDLVPKEPWIVVRGYLGFEDGGWAALNTALQSQNDATPPMELRLFLTATLDTYVTFDSEDVLHVQLAPVPISPNFPDSDLDDVVATVFLKKKAYTRVVTRELDPEQQFVRGQLVDEYLASAGTGTAVWPEQAYDGGPTLSKGTGANYHCP